MTPSKTSKNDKPNKISPGKSPLSELSPGNRSANEAPLAKGSPSTFRLSPTPLPKTSHLTLPTRKPSISVATQRKPSATPQSAPQRKPSGTPKICHLIPPEHKPSLTPKSPSPCKPSAIPQAGPPGKPVDTPRKPSAPPKVPSPPKPDWKAPPGKPCAPSPSFSPSPTHIPLPVFASSPRQEVAASPGSNLRVEKGIGGLCTPVPAPRRRSGAANTKISSPLVCEVSGEEDTPKGYGEEVENKKIKGGEVKGLGLGLGFKDPFSSTLGSGSGSVIEPISGSDFISGSSIAKSAIPRGKSIADTLSPTSPISPRPRIYTPTSTATTPTFTTAFTTVATKHKQPPQGEGVSQEEEETPKRDSLSPIWSTSAITSFKPTTIPTPSLISSTSPRTHFSKLDLLAKHHRHRHFSPSSILPLSPASTHPYTGNTHIMPSCTVGALTHRLRCGHLVLTERAEVCGANCEYALPGMQEGLGGGKGAAGEGYAAMGGGEGIGWERVWRGKIERKRKEAEKGFVGNVRDLDAEWVCPCCGNGKGRRCVVVLNVELGG